MTRKHQDWLKAFMEYASFSEAPPHMHFWSGVSAIAGALRRKVWIDQAYFRWHPNFYICFVAPPGIVSKSTTAGIAMDILRKVPDVKFGPDVVTWQSLVTTFEDSLQAFEFEGAYHNMCALTLESSEFGNLLDPQDKKMVDLLVSLWDGKQGVFKKSTKNSGSDAVENPWINLIACTTPSWIAGNFPEYMIGGGFTSRTIFVYADAKHQYVAYPGLAVPKDLPKRQQDLVDDLTHIANNLCGEYRLSPEAIALGEAWYKKHYSERPANLNDDRFGGYIARKQVHAHKLAMILAASESDELVIKVDHLAAAIQMLTELEPDMQFVFSKIGRSEASLYAERLIAFVGQKRRTTFQEAYRHVHAYFPSMRDFEDVFAGAVRAGYLKTDGIHVVAGNPLETATNGTASLHKQKPGEHAPGQPLH